MTYMAKTRKIDFYVRKPGESEFRYYCSTTWSATLKVARARFEEKCMAVGYEVKAAFA